MPNEPSDREDREVDRSGHPQRATGPNVPLSMQGQGTRIATPRWGDIERDLRAYALLQEDHGVRKAIEGLADMAKGPHRGALARVTEILHEGHL